MNGRAYLRFITLSVLLAITLAGISLLLLNRLSDQASATERNRFLLFLAESIEERMADKSLDSLENPLTALRPPPPPERDGKPRPPPPFGRPPHGGPQFWLVDGDGKVLFNLREGNLPLRWDQLEKPSQPHEITENSDFFRFRPAVQVIRLEYKEPVYLVATGPRPPGFLPLLTTHALIVFLTVSLGFIVSFSFLFIYLRRKSLEAREVLKKLAQGDLKARFPLQRFDELGGLLVDFNYMADQIERLVNRIHETESARKNLVQELGHDLRTPLTSLRAAVETLKDMDDRITPEEHKELLSMIESEILYFGRLIENLMVISSLDEPQFKSSTSVIDLSEVLIQQIKRRQQTGQKQWDLVITVKDSQTLPILGDTHLVERLLTNAFNNAEKFARTSVTVKVSKASNHYDIEIIDDGPGMGESEIKNFGVRRSFTNRRLEKGLDTSLGLGSVIMKSIAELHGGQVKIDNVVSDGQISGAKVTISLPIYI
ncbi:MAG: HAMP domain-containing protein [Bdellovibrionales bacterium]|nr:HAMP domain-containing protein [Bdellovibrionales bacterium]